MVNSDAKKERIEELRAELAELEGELQDSPETWQPDESDYYGLYHATSGLTLGIIGALVSLLFNVVGSLIVGQHPLRLIQVYLTFPLGERAMSSEFDTGIILATGCCLYIGTGMLLGIVFQMSIARFIPHANLMTRMLFATVLGLLVWGVNHYGILSWLQPLLFGGNWISDPSILPLSVGAATHLVFGWTMAYVYPWGKHERYLQPSAASQAS